MTEYVKPFPHISDEYQSKREAIEQNLDLTEASRRLRLAKLKTEYRERWNEQRAGLEGRFHNDLRAAYQRVNPPRDLDAGTYGIDSGLVVKELKKQDYRRELIDMMRERPAGILAMHEDLYMRGDEFGLSVVEEYGRQFASATDAERLQELADIRNPGKAAARADMEALKAEQSTAGQAISLMESNFMQQTQLSAEENASLSNGGQVGDQQ
jgi:hypothetical protein